MTTPKPSVGQHGEILRLFARHDRPHISSDELLAAAIGAVPAPHYLYVLGLPHYPGVKIGISKAPQKRIKELSSLHCQKLEYYALYRAPGFTEAHRIELDVLSQLRAVWGKPAKQPPFSGKEWTKASPRAAVSAIEEIAESCGMKIVRARI